MYEFNQQTKRLFGSDNTMGLFVALYLILLAFFILLNAVSEQAIVKAEAAMESVNTTFKETKDLDNVFTTDPAAIEAPANDQTLNQIRYAFLTEMELEGRFSTEGGNIFEVQFSADSMFQRGSFRVRPERTIFLDRLIELVQQSPNSQSQKIALMFGSGSGPVDREMTRAQEIAVRRAGSLARYFREKGVPDGVFTIGFVSIPEGEIFAAFRSKPVAGAGS